MNSLIISGNLTKDPEMRYTSSNMPIATFTVAVNDFNDTEFIKVVTFKAQAENCHKYLEKGSKVIVEGKYHSNTWEDKEGVKHYSTECSAHRVEFIGATKQESTIQEIANSKVIPDVKQEIEEDLPF